MNTRSLRYHGARAQRGAVLFVALIFMVLLTLLGLAATGSSVLQERMTGGMRNAQMAQMGSESAMRGAEFLIWIAPQNSASGNKLTLFCSTDGTGGCYSASTNNTFSSNVNSFRTAQAWTASMTGASTYSSTVSGLTGANQAASLAGQPQFMIQMTGPDLPAGSTGGAGGSLQQQYGNGPGNQTKFIYAITARSAGGTANVLRSTESTFAALRAQY